MKEESEHAAEESGSPAQADALCGGVLPVGEFFVGGRLALWATIWRGGWHGVFSFRELRFVRR